MAAEVPVISSDAGGLPEININGFSGFLCPVGAVEEMSSRAIEILQDKETHELFRKNALSQALKFGIGNIIPQYESLYTRVIEESISTTS
jgi:glycosyltransferase involved in cell wall biosynthesis